MSSSDAGRDAATGLRGHDAPPRPHAIEAACEIRHRRRPRHPLQRGGPRLLVVVIGGHDVLHELVPDDVAALELDELDVLDADEDVAHLPQAGLAGDEVHLRDVAGHDDLAAEAEARQEHLHLLGARVLRLVQDDERVVQRAPAHERERRDLDDAALRQRRGLLDVHHVEQRVVQRPQVRVDLLEQVARQVAELLPRLDGRPREDDAADLLALQRVDGHRHGEVRLAGAGGADAERDGVLPDRVDVALLTRRLGPDRLAAVREDDVGEHLRGRTLAALEHVDAAVDRLGRQRLAVLDELQHLGEQRRDRLRLLRVARRS